MTLPELIDLIELNLTRVGSTRISGSKVKEVCREIVNYFATFNDDIFPLWTEGKTFNLDGTQDGQYTKFGDLNGKFRIWETKIDGNINHQPPDDPNITENDFWKEISASVGSSIKEWTPGLFPAGLQIVYVNHSKYGVGLAILKNPIRPFSSVSIETEIEEGGHWEFFAVSKNYVDLQTATIWKRKPVKAATRGALGYSLLGDGRLQAPAIGVMASIDGVALNNNDSVLLKDETDYLLNDVWVVQSKGSNPIPPFFSGSKATLIRRDDNQYTSNDGTHLLESFVHVQSSEGSYNGGKIFKHSYSTAGGGRTWIDFDNCLKPQWLPATTLVVGDVVKADLTKISAATDVPFAVVVKVEAIVGHVTFQHHGFLNGILTGLTIGQTIYVQSDGTLATTRTRWPFGLVVKPHSIEIKKQRGVIHDNAFAEASLDFPPSQASVKALKDVIDTGLHFRGKYTTLANLQSAIPAGADGDYAIVDPGAGTNAKQYIWDANEGWLLGSGGPVPDATETIKGSAEISTQAESEDAATNGTVGNIDHTRIISGRGLRWFWDKIKTLAITFTNSIKAKQLATDYNALVDAANIVWDAATIGSKANVTLAGNRILNAITNPVIGAFYLLRVIQDATGGRTLALDAAYTFPGTISPYINLAANATTTLLFYYDGTSFRYALPSNGYRLGDLFLENQKATSTNQRPTFIDNTGKVQKSQFINLDETNKKSTQTGKDNLNSVNARFENSDLAALIEIFNDFSTRFYGSVGFIYVPSDITAGNAGIETRDIDGIQWRERDSSSNDFRTLEKIAATDTDTNLRGKRITRFKKPIVLDTLVGSPSSYEQIPGVATSTAANTQNVILSLAIPTDFVLTLKLKKVVAYATNGNVVGMKDLQLTFKNVAGVVTGGVTTVTNDPVPNTITGIFNVNINGTSVELRFNNDTGTGRQYYVWGDYAYSIIPLPV